jgi:DnaK suppressor protein
MKRRSDGYGAFITRSVKHSAHANIAIDNASINQESPSIRLIAGVSVSDTALITAVIEYAQRISEPYLFNHAMRSWLFAEAIGRMKGIDTASDVGDASIADESESEDFTEAEHDTSTLQQVQAALRRIENGTYALCLVDGGPIEPKRLDAVPWPPYCIRHQKLLEATSRSKPTL